MEDNQQKINAAKDAEAKKERLLHQSSDTKEGQKAYQDYVKEITPTHNFPWQLMFSHTGICQRSLNRSEHISCPGSLWRSRCSGTNYRICQFCGIDCD